MPLFLQAFSHDTVQNYPMNKDNIKIPPRMIRIDFKIVFFIAITFFYQVVFLNYLYHTYNFII